MDSRFKGSLTSHEVESLHSKGLLGLAIKQGYVPVLAGATTSYGDAITNPLSAPTISGTQITVDFLLQNPTVVRREIADLVMRNFFLDKVFEMPGGGVTGGAVLYEQISTLDVYTDRDVERVAPGAEFPVVTGARIAPLIAAVEKFGGKFAVTDEAKNRNDIGRVQNQMRRLANTITRKMQQRGIAELEAAISSFSRTQAAPEAKSWTEATKEALLNRVPSKSPLTVILKAIEALENTEMGYTFDTLIVNPQEKRLLLEYYGTDAGRMDAALNSVGVTTLVSTPRKATKSAILTAGRQVGQMRLEEPMRTTTEREPPPLMREQTWSQTAVNPVFIVTDPYAAMELTTLS